MKKYALKTKDGDVLKTIFVNDIVEAIDNFSKIKCLSKTALVSIFVVCEIFG